MVSNTQQWLRREQNINEKLPNIEHIARLHNTENSALLPNNEKLTAIASGQCNKCIWASLVRLNALIYRRRDKCQNRRIKIGTRQISRTNSSITQLRHRGRINSIRDQLAYLRAQGFAIAVELSELVVELTASKPHQI